METKRYVDMRVALKVLGLRGDEDMNSSGGGDIKRKTIETRTACEIVGALKAGAVDAVKVTRCRECYWCLRSYVLRMPRCTCPEMPPHVVQEDGYCNYGKPKGGGGNG